MKELLEKIDLFSDLDDKILRKVSDAAIRRQYAKGDIIIRQGEMGLGMYIILQGRVKVETEQGGARVTVAELGSEQSFAEMALVDNKPRSATITALDDTECVLLTRDSFLKLMQKHPQIPIRIAGVLAERLRVTNEKLAAAPATPASAASAPAPGAAAGTDASAPPPAAQSSPGDNGAAPAPAAAEGTKGRIQDALLGAFQTLYTMKAFTRFSVAVLGCPVEGFAANVVDQIRIGDVKALVLPAGRAVELNIAARESGSFTLHLFEPTRDEPIRFGPVPIRPEDRVRLLMDPPAVELRHGDRLVPAVS